MTNSQRFDDFIDFVLDHEGRYFEDDKDDPGGRTKFGIDQRSHPDVDIRNLTQEQAIEIYFQEWRNSNAEAMPFPDGEVYFDCRVNCGAARAKDFASGGANAISQVRRRESFYKELAAHRMIFNKFLAGWLNRCTDLRARFSL